MDPTVGTIHPYNAFLSSDILQSIPSVSSMESLMKISKHPSADNDVARRAIMQRVKQLRKEERRKQAKKAVNPVTVTTATHSTDQNNATAAASGYETDDSVSSLDSATSINRFYKIEHGARN